MLKSLEKFLKTDFEKQLFEEAIKNLKNKQSKIRQSNFAYALRSLIDYIFENQLAVNDKVKKASWYSKDSEEREITRRQRYKYFIQGEIDDYFIQEIIKFNDIDTISQGFNKAVHKLSKYTHISEKTFNLSDEAVESFIKEIDEDISTFFDNIICLKNALLDKLSLWLFNSINDKFISDTIQDIDELCTHYFIDYADIEEVTIINKEDDMLFMNISEPFEVKVIGTIYVEHQFGSDGDYKRGYGLKYNASYPYSALLKVDLPLIKILIDDEEYDITKCNQEEKDEINKIYMDEFYRNVQLLNYNIDTSKHFE